MDGPFNVDNIPALIEVSTPNIANSLSIDTLARIDAINCIGIIDINNGLLKTTAEHMHIFKRDGVWISRAASALQVGDKLYHISGIEIEITTLVEDSTTPYVVYKLDTEPNDTFFANGILTHNKKPGLCDANGYGPFLCDEMDPCYDPCSPYAKDFGCEWQCDGGGVPIKEM
jgi:hypothetical protein